MDGDTVKVTARFDNWHLLFSSFYRHTGTRWIFLYWVFNECWTKWMQCQSCRSHN